MPRLDGCTETVDVLDLTVTEVAMAPSALLDRLDLVVTRSDYGEGSQIDLITKEEAEVRHDAYEKEYR
jgi:hypothetical protein